MLVKVMVGTQVPVLVPVLVVMLVQVHVAAVVVRMPATPLRQWAAYPRMGTHNHMAAAAMW